MDWVNEYIAIIILNYLLNNNDRALDDQYNYSIIHDLTTLKFLALIQFRTHYAMAF